VFIRLDKSSEDRLIAMRHLLFVLAFVPALVISAAEPESPELILTKTISDLDAEVFDAFNHCADAAQLNKHSRFFANNVEFYHDSGGVTWDRKHMIANTKKFACGRYTRELVPGTLKVFPIRGFGAIEQGAHRFCQVSSGKCEGLADFVMVWRHSEGRWQITRVLSYGHRAAEGTP